MQILKQSLEVFGHRFQSITGHFEGQRLQARSRENLLHGHPTHAVQAFPGFGLLPRRVHGRHEGGRHGECAVESKEVQVPSLVGLGESLTSVLKRASFLQDYPNLRQGKENSRAMAVGI